MIDEIMKLAISNGLWAVLFVFLFFFQIKDSKKREKNYIEIIQELSKEVGIIKKVDNDLKTISNNVLNVKKIILKKGNTNGL